VKILFSKLEDE